MLVPTYLHGRFREVKAACRRKVTLLKRGASWDELTGELMDTDSAPGYLVLDGPSPLLGGAPHYHFFAITRAIRDAVPPRLPHEIFETLFEPAIHTIWGFLAMLGPRGHDYLRSPMHQVRLLHLAVRWWPELDAQGPRYTTGVDLGARLWEEPSTIKYCLVHQGLSEERFDESLPMGGMAELVAQTHAGLPPTPDQLH